MIIELPRKFSYVKDKTEQKIAWVKKGVLYIKRGSDYNKVMHELTYKIKGDSKCYYCRSKVAKEKITVDHIYPKDFGGPTIPNNLQPSCSKCNKQKTNMNLEEYLIFKSLEKEERDEFLENIMNKKETLRKEVGYDFPKELITTQRTSKINADDWHVIRGRKYKQVEAQYNRYKTFKRPIVTDRCLNLIDGFSVYLYATTIGKEKVPVIVLENVQLVDD